MVGGRNCGYVFPSAGGHITGTTLWLVIHRLAKRAGIDGGVHRFRHTFAHEFLADGGDVGDLKVILGHSTITMSLRYAAYSAAERALEAQRRHNPADRLTRVV
jgi:integrase